MSDDSKMSTNECKSENDLCRCCHSEGSYKNLYTSYFWLDVEKVVYSAMLRECYNIELLEMREPSQHVLCAICYTCIKRLEDAIKFKRQIEKCEKRFLDVYSGCVSKDPTYEVNINVNIKEDDFKEVNVKEEILDPEENVLFDTAVSFNGGTSDGNRAGDRHNADGDDDDNGAVDNVDIEHDTGEAILEEDNRLKSAFRRKKTKTTSKVKKKNKIAKKPAPIKEEDVLGTIEGGIRVMRGPMVRRNVDFKETEDGYQCLKCLLTTKNPNSMRGHVRKVHLNILKYKCPSCPESFSTITTFTKHKLDKHDMDHRFKCNACDSVFNTKVQLKKHINIYHMLGVKIKCAECDYETFSVESLYKHKFKHKTVKDYQCKYCKKAFVRKTTLQLHERIHTGDRRKVCSVCGQAFVQKASLNYHMTKYHPEVAF